MGRLAAKANLLPLHAVSLAVGTHFSGAYPADDTRTLTGQLKITADGGGGGTVIGNLQHSFDDGATWVDLTATTTPALTLAGTDAAQWALTREAAGLAPLIRYKVVVSVDSVTLDARMVQHDEV